MSNNVTMNVKGNTLTIIVDLSKPGVPSKTGKTDLIATTGGFQPLPTKAGISIALNVCQKR